MKLGIVGLGVIGRAVVRAADEGKIDVEIPVATTLPDPTLPAFLSGLKNPPKMTDLDGVAEGADIVLEAAQSSAVESICRAVLPRGKDVIVNSVGALLERPDLVELARANGAKIRIPSGAMIGLDGLKGASMGRVDAVTMTTRKAPKSLRGAPFLLQHKIDVDEIVEPTVIFEGSPIDACRGFPANVNVSAAVSMAGIGPVRTKMRIICDPTVDRNIHELEVEGEFGSFYVRVENVPSENHRTAVLAYLSDLALLRRDGQALVLGT
ncbi:MAG: aspartate dehydrogenase [bacterium]|nr:aspartate dehydrogenase [bacterium]